MIDPNSLGAWLQDAKTSIDLMKLAVGMIPKGADQARAIEQIGQAEDSLARSEAAAAKEFGYPLCQCTFPPQIMLWDEKAKASVCPRPECGHTFQRGMKISAEAVERSKQPGPHSWMGR
jgi:hypothetical protein